MGQKITQSKLSKIFGIQKRSFETYTEEGVFREVGYTAYEPLFDADHICEILGLKRLPDEPFVTTDEAMKILGLPIGYKSGNIRAYCSRHKIPFYFLKNNKGTKTYFLRSELETALVYTKKWDINFPDYVAKSNVLREILKQLINPSFCKSLNKNEINVITEIIVNGKNLIQTAEFYNISYESTRGSFISGYQKILYELKEIGFNFSRLSELGKENIKLKCENDVLIDKLNSLTKEELPIVEQDIETLSKHFDDKFINTRMRSLLNSLGVNNLYELSNLTRSHVEKYQGFGKKTIDGLEMILKNNGLNWKKEPEMPKTSKLKKIKKKYKKTNLIDIKSRLLEIENKLRINNSIKINNSKKIVDFKNLLSKKINGTK